MDGIDKGKLVQNDHQIKENSFNMMNGQVYYCTSHNRWDPHQVPQSNLQTLNVVCVMKVLLLKNVEFLNMMNQLLDCQLDVA